MQKIAFWHVYLTEDTGTWAGIVMEQLGVMERSGLLQTLDELYVTSIYRDWSEAVMLEGVIQQAYPRSSFKGWKNPFQTDREMLANISAPEALTEALTLKEVWDKAHNLMNDTCMLYFHTKGITADERFLKTGNYAEYQKYYYWRQLMNWAVLEQWPVCVDALDDVWNMAGANFQELPCPHYSGGCYWTKSSYVKTLPDPTMVRWWFELQAKTTDPWLKSAPMRFRNEMWITQGEYNAFNLASGIDNPASKFVSTREYWS